MRPEELYPLFAPMTSLNGVGAKYAKAYQNLCGGDKVIDLLWHLPSCFIYRNNKKNVDKLVVGEIATLTLEVVQYLPVKSSKSPVRVLCKDDTGEITLVFFKAFRGFLQKNLPIGEKRIVSGKVEMFDYVLQMTHPDYILPLDKEELLPLKEPVYPLSAGLSSKMVAKAVANALEKLPCLPEWLNTKYKEKNGLPKWDEAIRMLHSSSLEYTDEMLQKARQRLQYDEILAGQLALSLVRNAQKSVRGRIIKGNGDLRKKGLEVLPFKLTAGQIAVLKEIGEDMARPSPMLRLLQGDVGSGKTIVAFFALLNALECGMQGALMAPTDILARQHFAKLKPIAEQLEIRLALLTGKTAAKDKTLILNGLKDGTINIVIGTHSLIESAVIFKNLGLAVIDEQHKFGVHQRLSLTSKGGGADVLVMTATPIPRTLVLTMYGDMDISILSEKPAGRQPIKTVAISLENMPEVVRALSRALAKGSKIYWICPLVQESEKSDLAAVVSRKENLEKLFSGRVAMVHGKMKPQEKEEVMAQFALSSSPISILVATTVVEVGVDVPIANVMVIEHSERFGLAQLHQLRGRIGRGKEESSCILLYSSPLCLQAKERIKVMRETDDGFQIAEKDLELRGFGEVLGVRQSGMPDFKLTENMNDVAKLLPIALKDTQMILEEDKALKSFRGEALWRLLYLFGQDEKITLIKA